MNTKNKMRISRKDHEALCVLEAELDQRRRGNMVEISIYKDADRLARLIALNAVVVDGKFIRINRS